MLRTGKAERGERVLLYVAPSDGTRRVGFVTGRRLGGAVVRNRARRLLREGWRVLAPKVPTGYDIVLVAQKGIEGASARDVTDDMEGLLRRAGMLAP